MDTNSKIKEVKSEYKAYLTQKHPEWAESTVSTHVSDAFYIWNNSILPGFWKALRSEATMEDARKAIEEYIKTEVQAPNYVERTKGYCRDLQMLKAFLDEEFGGVERRIGEEFWGEEILYEISKAVYEGKRSEEGALQEMSARLPNYSVASHKMTLGLFRNMIEGKKYTRRGTSELTICFIRNIGRDYGPTKMLNALQVTRDNIIYYYSKSGNKSNCMRKSCQQISDMSQLDVDFSDHIFDGIVPQASNTSSIGDNDVDTIHYWIYSPGDNASKWDEFYARGIMGLGWSDTGYLLQFNSKDEIKHRMKAVYGDQYSYKNAAHATWQFANEMKPGDVIFCKKGLHQIVGRGIVTSDYRYEPGMVPDYAHVRDVRWTHFGQWAHPGQAVMKTLTDITAYTEYVEKLNALFVDETDDDDIEIEAEYPVYDAEKFLEEVYMDSDDYSTLVGLLRTKKNVILQGAPGVGKTFAAKRLAYSMMGCKDQDRVMLVQFHQSYTYEDFIEGFRPCSSGQGFEIKKGSFYSFCKKAGEDPENEYFFIIDEINRGNLSKIFGELFMLIENDKRGNALQLLYSGEKFKIPPKLYIIGMMNTADRSLAMMDYALRRRFAFYTMTPQFQSEGFREYLEKVDSDKLRSLIACVENMNSKIAEDDSLGSGFCIGHSYFCNIKDLTLRTLSNIVEYELIPLLNEYWFDEPTKVKEWAEKLRSAIK